jgi:hypothetical protein
MTKKYRVKTSDNVLELRASKPKYFARLKTALEYARRFRHYAVSWAD